MGRADERLREPSRRGYVSRRGGEQSAAGTAPRFRTRNRNIFLDATGKDYADLLADDRLAVFRRSFVCRPFCATLAG